MSFQEYADGRAYEAETLKHVQMSRHPSSQKFHDLLDEIARLHDSKQHDYGKPDDPFRNVRSAEEFGIAPWLGCTLRMNDKISRIKSFAINGGVLKHESVEDSLKDIAVYALIALVLFREGQ